MPRPLHLLRDGPSHWLANPARTANGLFILRNQADVFRVVYEVAGARVGVQPLPPTPENRDTTGDPLPVVVNANRWVVACPECGGAEFAWPEDPWFLCGSCFNAATGGKWRPVLWPGDTEITEVEDTLSARSNPFTRNWNAEEADVGDLKAENVANGEPPEWQWGADRPPKRINRSRPAGERSGTRWRDRVKKRKPIRSAIVLPRGWGEPTTITLPDGTDENEGVLLYPDAPPPPDPESFPLGIAPVAEPEEEEGEP